MGVWDIFSKRQKRARGEAPDVYQYDTVPRELRVQAFHILTDAYTDSTGNFYSDSRKALSAAYDVLCREYGWLYLQNKHKEPYVDLFDFLINTENAEAALDVIEVCINMLPILRRGDPWSPGRNIKTAPIVEELNTRFQEAGVGYNYASGNIIRVDSQFIHSESVKPTLALLTSPTFKTVNKEFLEAHEHYRHGRLDDCANECLKAFESMLKTICHENGWTYKETDTAKRLIEICFQNNLVPPYLQTQLRMVQQLLESGIPTIRNKTSGHGGGPSPQPLPEYLVQYALHLTATNLLFLAESSGVK